MKREGADRACDSQAGPSAGSGRAGTQRPVGTLACPPTSRGAPRGLRKDSIRWCLGLPIRSGPGGRGTTGRPAVMRVWTGLRGGTFGGWISPPGREPGEVGGERGVWDEASPEEGGAPWETRGLAGGVMTSLEAEPEVADRGGTQLEGSSRQLVWGLELKEEDGAGAHRPWESPLRERAMA